MPGLIAEALRSLRAAVVLRWKFAVAKRDSKPCQGVPVVQSVYIAAGPRASDKIVGPCGASHAGRFCGWR